MKNEAENLSLISPYIILNIFCATAWKFAEDESRIFVLIFEVQSSLCIVTKTSGRCVIKKKIQTFVQNVQ